MFIALSNELTRWSLESFDQATLSTPAIMLFIPIAVGTYTIIITRGRLKEKKLSLAGLSLMVLGIICFSLSGAALTPMRVPPTVSEIASEEELKQFFKEGKVLLSDGRLLVQLEDEVRLVEVPK